MNKKFLSVLLATAMTFTMSGVAFAAPTIKDLAVEEELGAPIFSG